MRVLFVSRERHRLPLDDVQRRKWDAIAAQVEPRIVAAAPAGYPTHDERFRLVLPLRPRALDGVAFYASLPPDLKKALAGDAKAKAFFDGLTYSQQRWYVLPLEQAKKQETRERRLQKAVTQLRAGRKP